MNSKRPNVQQIDNSGLKTAAAALSNNAENDDPHPNIINNYNIINATELNLDLLPKKSRNANSSRPITARKNESIAAAAVKSFDRNKAREHIAEQQRKRLLEKKAAVPDAQKDDIKKRLAALHQNSLKIVKKNVSKKRKDLCTLAKSTEAVDRGEEQLIFNVFVVGFVTKFSLLNFSLARGTSEYLLPTTSENKVATPIRKQAPKLHTIIEAQYAEPAIDATPSKRGILRRKELFDGPPTSHSPPRLDKTFIDSLLQTVKQRQSTSDHHESSSDCHSSPPRIDENLKLRVPQSELKSKALRKNSSKTRSKSWDLTRTSNTTNKRSGSTKMPNESGQNIPFFLKPTSAQAYPYNFIMAVRKKLESVTQPVLMDPLPPSDTPLARPKNSRSVHPSNFRKNLENPEELNVAHESSKMFLNLIDSIPVIKSTNGKPIDKSDDQTKNQVNASGSEEFSTNFSSMSLLVTDRNTMSELSSIHSEQPNHTISASKISQHNDVVSDADDTTISSAILSQNSPEKKNKPPHFVAAPLSTDAIKDLKICSSTSNLSSPRTKESSRINPFVNSQRGDSDNNQTSNDLDQRSIGEMFETFSKNLSQVISVNKRLHSALSTSLHNSLLLERDDELKIGSQSVSNSIQRQQMDSDPVYTTSFEVTNNESIPEANGINSRTKSETDLPSRNDDGSEETVKKDVSTTKTVSEQKTESVVVTTTIDTQTVTSRKTEILSNTPPKTNDSIRIDPEFRYSTASSMIGSDIFAVFSQSDEEQSLRATNQSVSYEESFNYSSIGMVSRCM